MQEKEALFRREAEIIEKRFIKFFYRPPFSKDNPDSIHNHYVLYFSGKTTLFVVPSGSILPPVIRKQLEEAFKLVFD